MIRTRSRRPWRFRVRCTRIGAGSRGMPTVSANSSGAAPVPPSAPSTVMKSGPSQLGHDAAELGELLSAADAKLDAHRLSAAQFAQLPDEVDHPTRIGERWNDRVESTVSVRFHMPEAAISSVFLAAGSTPHARAWRPRQLQLDRLDRLVRGLLPEQVGIEMAILVAAAEVARTDAARPRRRRGRWSRSAFSPVLW